MRVIFVLAFISSIALGYNVHLYQDTAFDGRTYHVMSHKCEDIPDWMKYEVSSINTHGTCIFIYKESGCSGEWGVMAPGTLGFHNLKEISFDNVVRSIGPCRGM